MTNIHQLIYKTKYGEIVLKYKSLVKRWRIRQKFIKIRPFLKISSDLDSWICNEIRILKGFMNNLNLNDNLGNIPDFPKSHYAV